MPVSFDPVRALALEEPFVPGDAASPEEFVPLSARLVRRLGGSGDHEPRRELRRLLTLRPPGAFPSGFLEDLDRLLAGEARLRPVLVPPPSDTCQLWHGDITRLGVDAIVNAANSALLGCFVPFHACIDNAIHSVAGPRLREDCDVIQRWAGRPEPVGSARVTRGYHLPARFVVHTVGPMAHGSRITPALEGDLAACYRACLDAVAAIPNIRSIAFCSISTGVFGYPAAPAARSALATVREWLSLHPGRLDRVIFDVFSETDRKTYESAW